MKPELALTTISHTEIAIFLLTFLIVLLISVRKELSGDASVRGVFQFGLLIIGLCTVVALMAAYLQARKMVLPDSNAQRLDTTNRFTTWQGDNMNLRELLSFNLFLQLFDGTASYFILSRGEAELNPFVSAAIDAWGLLWALVYWKVFVCALLVILYSLRRYRSTRATARLDLRSHSLFGR